MDYWWNRFLKSLKGLYAVSLIFLFTPFLYSQPIVHTAGDSWQFQVDSAFSIIKRYDPKKYELLDSVCDEVDFWLGDFSSCFYKQGSSVIYISVNDVKLNSINNLACILVHESLHLYFDSAGLHPPKSAEEKICYAYELDFLRKIPNAEPWLLDHAKINQ